CKIQRAFAGIARHTEPGDLSAKIFVQCLYPVYARACLQLYRCEIDCKQRECDEQNFYDEKPRTAGGDSHGRQQDVLYIGVERKQPRVPLIAQCLPNEPDMGGNAGPEQPRYQSVPARSHLTGTDACL